MLFYTDQTDIELVLKQISRKLKWGDHVMFRHGDITCKLDVLDQVKLVYISWDMISLDGDIAREGLCTPIEEIESVEIDEATLTIRSVFNCTVDKKLTGSQTLVFKGTIGKMVMCKDFESLIEQEQIETETENICLH
jgi:hypothetical protein